MTIETEMQVPIGMLKTAFQSKFLPALFDGTATHDPARGFIGQMVSWTKNVADHDEMMRAVLPAGYKGNTLAEVPALVEGAIKKFAKKRKVRSPYEPSRVGPIPLGFTKDGYFAFRDQRRNLIVLSSSSQLLSYNHLLGLAPSQFWRKQYPPPKESYLPFNQLPAGEALIEASKKVGPFDFRRVRGRGVWLEDDRVIVNLGGPIPDNVKNLYLCFEPIPLADTSNFDAQRLLDAVSLFSWANAQDARLYFGWLAIAPICGALNWRPHAFVFGPARCGKTTLYQLGCNVLKPLIISADGQSSEAGIRQTLGADSLPIALDEFESDQKSGALKGVIRLARSASSADNPVLKGTPEGKAMEFSLRTTFLFCAVNPSGMSVADESRIIQLQIAKHKNNDQVRKAIRAEASHFRQLGPKWCAYMTSLAQHINPAIDAIEQEMSTTDQRHKQNMSTLLAGSFVAIHRRPPTIDEARALAAEFDATTELHAEALDRDDAQECLHQLFSYVVERYPLGHWVAVAYRANLFDNSSVLDDAIRIVRMHDIIVWPDKPEPGFVIRNQSPSIEKAFWNSRWEGGVWKKALQKLEGVQAPGPVYFSNTGTQHRCLLVPEKYVPEPYPIIEKNEPVDSRV